MNRDFPTPDNIKKAAIAAIDANFTKYTPTGGTVELKQAICERHHDDYGTAYTPAECLVTVGGKHAIFNLMQALIKRATKLSFLFLTGSLTRMS